MKVVDVSSKKNFLKQIQDALQEKLSKKDAEGVDDFVSQLLVSAYIEEFAGRRLADVMGSLLGFWKFVQTIPTDRAKVEVYNPNLEEFGWQSTHTIVAVLCHNMPFIIDSVRMVLTTRNVNVHGIQHAILQTERDAKGKLVRLKDSVRKGKADDAATAKESVMLIEVDRHSNQDALNALKAEIESVLADVRTTVQDYPAMLAEARSLAQSLADGKYPGVDASEQQEGAAFLNWVADDSFTFLGYVEYHFEGKDKQQLVKVPGSALGILRHLKNGELAIDLASLSSKARKSLQSPELFTFAKAYERSRVHRPAYPDYISVKQFDAKGRVTGEKRFVGLYTARAYNETPDQIPLLRQKVQKVREKSEFDAVDYSGRALEQMLIVYPRDELFQIDVKELFHTMMSTLYIQERRKIKLFMREDAFGGFVTCIVYVPRDIFNTDLRLKIQRILMEALNGEDIDFSTYISESVLARTLFNIKVTPVEDRHLDVDELERRIIAIAQSWQDDLQVCLIETHGEEKASRYEHLYRQAFPTSYRDEFSPRQAAIDIGHIVHVSETGRLGMSFYRALDEDDSIFHFKLFHADQPVPLSDVMPVFDHMGFRVIGEHPYETLDSDGRTVWIHDFMLTTAQKLSVDLHKIRDHFEELFEKVWLGEAENDSFNRLVIAAYMNWREIAMLRAYARYMRQIRVSNSQSFIADTLVNHVEIARLLVEMFACRFDPAQNKNRKKAQADLEALQARFAEMLDRVPNLTEDKILRLYLDLVSATVRTNFYQKDDSGADKSYIAFKFHPRLIPNVPKPVPKFEIFVYSPRVEGVHLRGGKVARGGLRWSDRYEDYRTEVLGLVKAQQVKNAVIVPVGAKGGFVAKKLPQGDRAAYMKEGIASYQIFVTGLLDVTDNLVEGKVVPPQQVVRHDEDDYYLVVAADKGTASFSDIANAISLQKGHWLGDAFASGGSQGYDHKKMGITARGGWVSVMRHFRELGINTQTTPFTVIGIGDMAGDVFGNGLLMSNQAKLIAAFNHVHIFLDPNPDPAKSFIERQRLFDLPGSSWDDYDAKLISKGGGVFARSAKSIPLSAEVKAWLGVDADKLTPNELMSEILKANADLLWNGGIGTYVRATTELDADVGDKANDPLRVTGSQLRVKVIGEGGNLGMTQLGRIEYARRGGRLNTDFIDNAGGVDCSDHEVNIKILLNEVLQNGDLTEKQRNKLLAEMTDAVGDLVLKNNYLQTQAISIAHREGLSRMEEYRRLINAMEAAGKLNRTLEYIPTDDMITERKSNGEGLTRPELAVLISYVKGDMKEVLLASELPDNPNLKVEMEKVFPAPIVKKFNKELHAHRLSREIISTQIANDMVNHMGITFVERLRQSTGASTAAIALSYIIARDVFQLDYWWHEIEQLDYKVPADLQMYMMSELMSLMRRACRWLIRNRRSELNVQANMDKFAKGIVQISKSLPNYLQGSTLSNWQERFDRLKGQCVPEHIAAIVAGSRHLYAALGIIEAQDSSGQSLDMVGTVYYALGNRLELTWFGQQINALTPLTHWQALAREAFREDLDWQQRALTVGLLKLAKAPKDVDQRIDCWMQQHQDLIARWQATLTEFKASSDAEFSMYSVALRELLDLAQSTVHAVG